MEVLAHHSEFRDLAVCSRPRRPRCYHDGWARNVQFFLLPRMHIDTTPFREPTHHDVGSKLNFASGESFISSIVQKADALETMLHGHLHKRARQNLEKVVRQVMRRHT